MNNKYLAVRLVEDSYPFSETIDGFKVTHTGLLSMEFEKDGEVLATMDAAGVRGDNPRKKVKEDPWLGVYINGFIVEKSARGKGLGTKFYNIAEKHWKSLKHNGKPAFRLVWILAAHSEEGVPSEGFWKKMGFDFSDKKQVPTKSLL